MEDEGEQIAPAFESEEDGVQLRIFDPEEYGQVDEEDSREFRREQRRASKADQ